MNTLFLIAGLGNPEKKFQNTRHNFGFQVLDYLAKELATPFQSHKKLEGDVLKTAYQDADVIFFKPHTFMNLSGRAVSKALDYYRLPPQHLLVIHDDIDLPFGKMRLSFNAGPAGHKGVLSIIDTLKTKRFYRLRLGIAATPKDFSNNNVAPAPKVSTEKFVLQNFSHTESQALKTFIPRATEAVSYFIRHGFHQTAEKYNQNQ